MDGIRQLKSKIIMKKFVVKIQNMLFITNMVNQHIPFVNNCAKYSN